MPRTVVAALASRRVRALVNGVSFEATLGTYGGRTFLGLRKQVLADLGIGAGDQVHVELEALPPEPSPTEEPASVTCAELDRTLTSDPALAAAWVELNEMARDEYGRWISAGAQPDDRAVRIARLRHRLLPG